ncbi:MAG: hypothetical protein HYV67_04715 [Candidatus Taylorbacteria bacterium]|nr:hypothetical protein [Candidatus Taylorbacteria bacterium]
MQDSANSAKEPVKVTHSSMVVFWEPSEGGEVRFLAFQYTRKKNGNPWTTWRFPNETGIKGEEPTQTAINGMHQEMPLNPNDFHFEFDNSGESIWVKQCDGDPDKGGGIHEKHVFLARIKRGELRTKPFDEPAKTDPKTGVEHPGETLGPPTWFEAETLLEMMHERGLRFHQEALIHALGFLAKDKAVASRYGKILAAHSDLG